MTEIQDNDIKCWGRYERTGSIRHCWWPREMVPPLWQFLNSKHETTMLVTSCTPGHLSREMKMYVYTKTCVHMFTANLFIIAPNRKQPSYLSVYEWLDKLWYTHTLSSTQ